METSDLKSTAIYHVKTEGAYDNLMKDLESKGYKWTDKTKPTTKDFWSKFKEETVIEVDTEDLIIIRYQNIERLTLDQEVKDYIHTGKVKQLKVLFKEDIENKKYIEYTITYQDDNYVRINYEKELGSKETYWMTLEYAKFEVKKHNWLVISEENFLTAK